MNRFRVVVVEGPRYSGKTTLARRLQDELGYRVRTPQHPDGSVNVFERYISQLTMALVDGMATGVVLDEFALRARVFHHMSLDSWRLMRDCLDSAGALRVLCLPPKVACLRVLAMMPQDTDDPGDYVETYHEWAGFRYDAGQVVYDWTLPGAADRFLGMVRGRVVDSAGSLA